MSDEDHGWPAIRRLVPNRFSLALLLLFLVVAVAAACGGDDSGDGNDPDDGFANPGFEEDLTRPCVSDTLDCWFALNPPEFIVSDRTANSGVNSALLAMRQTTASREAEIHYLVQEVAPNELPEVISGNYFVENWVKGTDLQYLQFVVIVFGGGDDLAPCPGGGACSNYQIRYLLAGIDREPFGIANAKFVFITDLAPVEGEWIHFERNLRQDFIDLWGGLPSDFTKIRVLFEVRYDGKTPTEGPLEADVFYDDLYMGPPR